MVLVVVCASAGRCSGSACSARAIKAGIAAEAVASVGIGLTLLLAFHEQHWSLLGDTLGAEALSGGSVGAAMLAALAVGGWVFIGFDACASAAEETQGRRAPRPAGDLDRAAQRRRAGDRSTRSPSALAHPDPAGGRRGPGTSTR